MAKPWRTKVEKSINPRELALLFHEFEKYLVLELYTLSFFRNYHEWHDDLSKRQLTDNELWKIVKDVSHNVEARKRLRSNGNDSNSRFTTGNSLTVHNLSKFLNQDSPDCWGRDENKNFCFKPSTKWTRIACAVDIQFLIEFADHLMEEILIAKNAQGPVAIAAADSDSEKKYINDENSLLSVMEYSNEAEPGSAYPSLVVLQPGNELNVSANALRSEGRDTADVPDIVIWDTADAPPLCAEKSASPPG